jgi:cell division protein ZapA
VEKNKVKLTICGAEYVIASGEENKYMIELGNEVDEKITSILRQNPRISVTQAAVLAALEFADAEKKATSDAEKLRSSIQEYLEDSSRDKLNCEIATREADRIAKEFAEYKKRHGGRDE